jgi:hypothetical protein
MLVGLAERRRRIAELFACQIADPRDPNHVTHSVADVLRARMLAIGCGYPDGNDLDWLRSDPAFKAVPIHAEKRAFARKKRVDATPGRSHLRSMNDQEIEMARAYYSTVLDHPADEIWSVIRPFDHYSWSGVPGETVIEDGKRGDQVGSIRRFSNGGKTIRQVLLAHSDIDRAYSYAFCDQPPFPVRRYLATIRVSPVVETNKAFVEWSATFDCAAEDYDRMIEQFEKSGFAVWLRALREYMAKEGTN